MDPAVFGYIRVSQAEGASGLDTQRRILTGHGLRDDRIFTDVASGRNMRRPGWQQLRGKLQPGDVVVVPRIDRLARNLTEGLRPIEELHAQGIYIRSLAEGPGHRGRQPNRPAHAEHAALFGRMGAGDHPGPDQGRRRPRRGRGKDGRQAPGAGLREGPGRSGLPGQQQRQRQRGTPDLQGEQGGNQGGQGRDLQRAGHVASEQRLTYHPDNTSGHARGVDRMGTTRFTAEVDSETLARAREILNREQITLDETLQEMLSHIVSHDTAPCFRCGDPNLETLQAMAEAEDGEMLPAGTVAALFTDLNEED